MYNYNKHRQAHKTMESENKHGQCRRGSTLFKIDLHNGFERLGLGELCTLTDVR